jgi:ATP-dependent Clp protease ATP-binding subunit ClpC
MRRAFERLLEDPFAESLLRGDIKEGDNVTVVRKSGQKTLEFKSQPGTPPAESEEPAAPAAGAAKPDTE